MKLNKYNYEQFEELGERSFRVKKKDNKNKNQYSKNTDERYPYITKPKYKRNSKKQSWNY